MFYFMYFIIMLLMYIPFILVCNKIEEKRKEGRLKNE